MIGRPLRTTFLLGALTVLFYWKILLSKQFTVLYEWEGVNQGYAWLQYALRRIRLGRVPLWDPFTFSGHSFIGEMQTSGLSPLNLPLALVPLNEHGLLPLAAYHVLFAFLHFLGLLFGYLLAKELRLKPLAAIITGLCFSMGGFVGHIRDWPDLIQSAIWLPLMFLFLIRALRCADLLWQLFNAALAGLAVGLAILGGRLHVVIMQVIVAITASAFYAWQSGAVGDEVSRDVTSANPPFIRRRLLTGALVVAMVGLLTVGAGALQLFPSLSYAPKAVRFFGETSGPGDAKIPYAYLKNDSALPESVVAFLVPFGFNAKMSEGELMTPYLGVLPFLLAIYGLITCWKRLWVRYFGFLALACTLYSFGPFSPLHGVLYAIVPGLSMMREASRIVYLSSFALAVLAGYGADRLFRPKTEDPTHSIDRTLPLQIFERALVALVIADGAVLIFGAAFNLPVNTWTQLSFVLLFMAYAVYRSAASGHVGSFAQFCAIFIVMFDLAAFEPATRNKINVAGSDALVQLVSCENAVNFLKSQPGPFRVDLPMPHPPNIGDAFGVWTNKGAGATLMANYVQMLGRPDLFDVQYIMKPVSATDPNPVYQDTAWKIYRTPNAFRHAWLIHKAETVSKEAAFGRLYDPAFDLHTVATTTDSLDGQLDPPSEDPVSETAHFTEYNLNRLKLDVTSKGRALLVLSEIYDNDWTARVNGKAVLIHPVDGGLRGIVVPDGQSSVDMRYLPSSVVAGGVLTGITVIGMLGFGLYMGRKKQHGLEPVLPTFPETDRDTIKAV